MKYAIASPNFGFNSIWVEHRNVVADRTVLEDTLHKSHFTVMLDLFFWSSAN